MQKFVRLLSYQNACKVIDFVNKHNKENYANITVGGISMQIKEDSLKPIEDFIKSLGVRYEIGDEHPEKVVKKIVSDLKNKGII